MTNTIMRVRNNNRRVVRGGTWSNRKGMLIVQVFEGETIKPQIDLTEWLGTETISSVSISSDGATVTESNASGVITLTVSGVTSTSDTELTITTSGSRVRIEKIRFVDPDAGCVDDYGWTRFA